MILINLTSITNQSIDSTKSQLNIEKIQFVWTLIKHYVQKKIQISDIVITSKYLNECNLLRRLIARDSVIVKIKIWIIDDYHDRKNDFIIFFIVITSKLNFMTFKNCVLVAYNCVKWKFIIINNFKQLLNQHN